MNELTLDGKTYVSSRRAAEITGYAKDYVGQLCREGHVEARLVGRNWYVLELSIREHRFGKQEIVPEAKKDTIEETWNKPRYETEENITLPSLAQIRSHIDVSHTEDRNSLLTDMESAWREWFTKKEADQPNTEEFVEETVTLEEPIIEEENSLDSEETPVPITAVYEEHNLQEEHPVIEEVIEEEEVIKQEPRIRVPHSRKGRATRNLILQSIFIAVALLFASISFIGSGLASKYSNISIYRLSEIEFIAGVAEYNNNK